MINKDSVLFQLTADDVLFLDTLAKLAKLAKEDAELINKKYKFKEGQEKIVVWNDGYNEESMTSDGFWHGDYLNNNYKVKCTAEAIFRLYRNQYLYDNMMIDGEYYSEESKIAANFKEFDEEINFVPVLKNTKTEKHVALSNSLAFGGVNSVIILGDKNA